ncbi:hypothetical protein Msil_1279 [Methylocella silvestris BL2]|uniref:Uncharacterized protein n=1 Tax=Methylocella silvestris (strain DSM 15510 / CIP 108128 / LMG 27833 / NCIMB 13906 / BL2) TaxID=395965 RepID=B8ER64_METSB|nr:hypothetical protein [Methylocella silvestris]ACK50248.1 hypothetical protein Msil_1279 [Methylocella silvestris BL2]
MPSPRLATTVPFQGGLTSKFEAAQLDPRTVALPRRQRLSARLRALYGPFATMTVIAALLALPRPVLAGPSGGVAIDGSANIGQTGSVTNINQPGAWGHSQPRRRQ